MNKTLAAVSAAVIAAGAAIMATAVSAAEPPGVPSVSEAVARAERAIDGHSEAIRGGSGDAYAAKRVSIAANGASHVRYDRTYRGLPVLGGDFVVHNAPGGAFASASVGLDRPITISTTPQVSAERATALAKREFAGKMQSTRAPQLLVDAVSGDATLAWDVVVVGFAPDGQTPSRLHVLIDATSGATRTTYDEIRHATGHGVHVGEVTIDTTQSGSQWTLTDPSHGNGRTCDMNNGSFSCATMNDADNVWGDGTAANRQSAAVDAHYGAAKTFDYFKNVHGRNGIFGDGRGVPSRVHYGNNYVNAFWDGSQMTYGDGSGNSKPLTAIDVAGHEMSHGVTEAVAGLVYSGESGGLNEGTSDIFGNMVEFYSDNATDPGDYEVGEKIDIRGNGTPLRYMYNPSLDGSSHSCWSTSTKNVDVHYSSGVANHFFFILAEGSGNTPYGNSPTCNNSSVTGIGRAKAEKIWWLALESYFTSSTKYVDSGTNDARHYTLQATKELYGECGAEYKTVQAAWSAVNVAGEDAPCGATPTGSPTSSPTSSPTTPPGDVFSNPNDYTIPDPGQVESPIAVTRSGNAPSTLQVKVDIIHTYRGDLVIDLVAPDGTAYRLKNSSAFDSADDVHATYSVNASSETASGTWRLRVRDVYFYDSGRIDFWSLQF